METKTNLFFVIVFAHNCRFWFLNFPEWQKECLQDLSGILTYYEAVIKITLGKDKH